MQENMFLENDNTINNKGRNAFQCPDCGKIYSSRQSLWSHRNFLCSNKKHPQFQCPHCPHTTNLKGNLKTHIGSKHADLLY